MSSHQHDFMFDTNFAIGSESVFTLVDHEESVPSPPVQSVFLLLECGPFLLLDGGDFNLL